MSVSRSRQKRFILSLLAMLMVWGTSNRCADIAEGPGIDVQDLLALLTRWGPCP